MISVSDAKGQEKIHILINSPRRKVLYSLDFLSAAWQKSFCCIQKVQLNSTQAIS